MPYVFNVAPDAMTIEERQYGTATQIQFTGFSSCIGLIVLPNNVLTAVHIAMRAPDDNLFDNVATDSAIGLLPAGYTSVFILGCISAWINPDKLMLDAYQHLTGQLQQELLNEYQLRDGTYGADIEDDAINITIPNDLRFQRGLSGDLGFGAESPSLSWL